MFISSFFVRHFTPPRVKHTFNEITKQIDLNEITKTSKKIYSTFGIRTKVFNTAVETWKNKPLLGIGIGSFMLHQNIAPNYHSHNFLLSILVEHGLVGMFFVSLFALILILKMKSWTGSVVLMIFPLTLIFDDLSWSYIFPVYLSFLIGILFYYAIRNKFRKSETNNF